MYTAVTGTYVYNLHDRKIRILLMSISNVVSNVLSAMLLGCGLSVKVTPS